MKKLNILWTSGEKETFKHMVAMYSVNALRNEWWDEVNVLIWGASTKLAGSDEEVQKTIQKMIFGKVSVEACKACADIYEATEILEEIGVDVKYTGTTLTDYINSEDKLITI